MVLTQPNYPAQKKSLVVVGFIGICGIAIIALGLYFWKSNQAINPTQEVNVVTTQKNLAQVLFTNHLTPTLTTIKAYAEITAIPIPGQEFVLNLGEQTVTAGVKFSTQLAVDLPAANDSAITNTAYLYALKPGDMITVLLTTDATTNTTTTTIQTVYFTQAFLDERAAELKSPPYVKLNPFFIPDMQFTAKEKRQLATGSEIAEEATVISLVSNTELLASTKDTPKLTLKLTPDTIVQVVTAVTQDKKGMVTSFEMSATDPRLIGLLEAGNTIRIEYSEQQSEQDSLSLNKILLYTF